LDAELGVDVELVVFEAGYEALVFFAEVAAHEARLADDHDVAGVGLVEAEELVLLVLVLGLLLGLLLGLEGGGGGGCGSAFFGLGGRAGLFLDLVGVGRSRAGEFALAAGLAGCSGFYFK
jgi:hypothetical protein